MVSLVFAVLLLGLCMLGISLRKVYFFLPPKELKRQAEVGDELAQKLWRAVSYSGSLQVLLWLWIGLSAAGSLVLFARIVQPGLGFIVIALLLWLAFMWLPNARISSVSARLSMWVTPGVVWLLNYLHPLFGRLADLWHRRYPAGEHTGLFEPDDLAELIAKQQRQPDSRMSHSDLERVERAISFSKRKVRDILIPRKKVKTLSATEPVGPILLDELHASGHARFPVYEGKKDQIVGTLAARHLDLKSVGKVGDFMEPRVAYIHESDSLAAALQAFYQTQQTLLIVVNSFEEYVGMITVDDILHALAGPPEPDEFTEHDSRQAVAAKHNKPKPAPSTEKTDKKSDKKPTEDKAAKTVSEPEPEVIE
ncbi:MAG TPA: CBS domain-containing protein [Candidatus Saccharimonadales bacterium]|nr:CBS domain-containing protein [Candidatus Saccharimonadales bacterium]